MEKSRATNIVLSALDRWWKRVIHKPAGEIALDLALFVMGVMVLYLIDLTIISRGAPVAFRYMLDLLVYLNHHAVATVQTLY